MKKTEKTKSNYFKEIFGDLKLNIICNIKIAIYSFPAAFLWLLIAMNLDENTNISLVFLIIILLLIAFIFTYIGALLFANWYNPLCTYEVDGKITRIIRSRREPSDGTAHLPFTTYRVIVVYRYKEKDYKKIISGITLSGRKMKNIKVKVKLCKLFPKMINIKEKVD